MDVKNGRNNIESIKKGAVFNFENSPFFDY
jgi:hypothetical protein